MGSVTHPRGRLPRRVYWVRRSVVIAVALLLVFGIGKLLGGTGSDAAGSQAVTTGSGTSTKASAAPASIGPVAPSIRVRAKAQVPLLPPSGDCAADDVSVVPSVPRAWAGTPVAIELQLTGTQPACTFAVSPESMVVKITSGNDRIWSSQDCPKVIPTAKVVVRSGQPVVVPVTWNGRRSDDQCTGTGGWALPGFYHVYAAALGSTPNDVQFEVTRAAPRLVTRTPRPKPSPSPAKSATSKSGPTPKPGTKSSPGAGVSGKQSKCGGDIAAGSC